MKADNFSRPEEQRRCFFCKRLFTPYPTVRVWQYACRRKRCQRLRQRLNELDWHQRHRAGGDVWYQVYYKAWRRKSPHYQKKYRRQKKNTSITEAVETAIHQSKESLKRLLKEFQAFQVQRRKQLQEQEQQLIVSVRAQRTGQLACGYG